MKYFPIIIVLALLLGCGTKESTTTEAQPEPTKNALEALADSLLAADGYGELSDYSKTSAVIRVLAKYSKEGESIPFLSTTPTRMTSCKGNGVFLEYPVDENREAYSAIFYVANIPAEILAELREGRIYTVHNAPVIALNDETYRNLVWLPCLDGSHATFIEVK